MDQHALKTLLNEAMSEMEEAARILSRSHESNQRTLQCIERARARIEESYNILKRLNAGSSE